MVLGNLIFQTEIVEQRFRAVVLPHHDQQASDDRNQTEHGQMLSSNMLLLNLILLIDVTFSTPTSVTTTLAFGTTPQGTATRYQTVILSNTGKFAALNLASISVGATVNYKQANHCLV